MAYVPNPEHTDELYETETGKPLKRSDGALGNPVTRDVVNGDADSVMDYDESRASGQRSILELSGLGKEVWQGIDTDEYIEEERKSWDG